MIKGNELIKKYFEENSLVKADIDSFNHFMEQGIQEIIKEIGDIVPTIIPPDVQDFRIRLDKIEVEKPLIVEADGSKRSIYPMEARLRKISYSAPIYLNISVHIDGVQRDGFRTQIGKIPIMLKSKYCYLNELTQEQLIEKGEDSDDPGGYFILNGNERILITVEDLASNKMFFDRKKTGPSKFAAQIFSEMGSYRIPHTLEQMKDGIVYLSFTRFKRIPVIDLIKALGLVKDEEISKTISEEQVYDDIIVNLLNSVDLKKQSDAIESVGKRMGILAPKEIQTEKVFENLDKYLLPHLGIIEKDRLMKAYNLCKLVKRFLAIAQKGIVVDKDHYSNKRLKLSGDLLMDLFRVNMRALVNDLLYNFQRLVKRGKFSSVKIIIRDKLLTSRIKSAMATGAWVGGRRGISQNMDRTNYLATLSHLQRVVSLLSASQENFEARALHSTHWGRLCLKKDTNILLADRYSSRNLEKLQNCWNHHKVITFDPKTERLMPSAISKYFTSNPKLMGKNVYRLVSESGREITATEDHPFYTKKGWVNAGELNKDDKVALYPSLDPIEQPELPTKELGSIIVDEKNIIKNSPNRFKHYIKELRKRELLPLTVNNYKIEIIARLLGHIFSDGYCGKYNLEFYCGSKNDAEAIANDIRLLGFEPSKISEKHTQIKRGHKIVRYKTFVLSKGGALHSLLVNSGAKIGKKTDIKVDIPKWLFKASLSVKREFLAGILGGDGPKPRVQLRKDRKSGSKLHIDNLMFHKKSDMKENIIKFCNDIKKLFNEFGILVKRIKIKEDYVRKDGSIMLKCNLVFGKSQSNIKKLLTKIGYRYCIQKEREVNYIGEWLRLREFFIKERDKLKNKIRKMHESGVTPREISDILKINYRVVNGWLFASHKYKKTRLTQAMLLPYEKWIEQSKLGDSGAVWEKIILKETGELDDVRDFTTTENTHSFIANGFITHNCPIETPEGTSIGLRKNLAILSTISQQMYDEEKIKKALYQIGLNEIKND